MKRGGRLLSRATAPVRRWLGRRSNIQVGVAFAVVFSLIAGAVVNRDRISLALKRTERITADFAGRPRVEPLSSKVKVAGVPVGMVTKVQERPGGVARVVMAVEPGTRAKLGTNPAAAARTVILLGGRGMASYVDLRRGGNPGRAGALIPPERTTLPVELDRILEVLNGDVRNSLQGLVRDLDAALADGGSASLSDLVAAAPPALRPAEGALRALDGEQPGDLYRLADRLGRAAGVLTEHDGELEAAVDGLAKVASRLKARSPELSATIHRLPPTLNDADAALGDLRGTLERLEATSPAARPAVEQLRLLVERAAPVLGETRSVVTELRPVLAEARPLIDNLVPTARVAEQVLADVDGPVLQRINDTVVPALLNPYTPSDVPLYQVAAFLVAGLAGAVKYTDDGGPMVRAYPSVNDKALSVSGSSRERRSEPHRARRPL